MNILDWLVGIITHKKKLTSNSITQMVNNNFLKPVYHTSIPTRNSQQYFATIGSNISKFSFNPKATSTYSAFLK